MKTRALIWLAAIAAVILPAMSIGEARQETQPTQEDLRKQIGTIIVTPGNGPNLAISDFIGRSAGLEAAVSTFN